MSLSLSSSAKRTIIWSLIALCVWYVVLSFLAKEPGQTFWAFALLYFLIPLTSLFAVQKWQSYIGIWGWILATILILLWGFQSFSHWAAWLAILWILYTIDQHREILSTKQITSWSMAYVHSIAFCMSCAVTISLSLMGKWENFTLTCDAVRETVSTHFATIMTPLRFTSTQVSQIQSWIDAFFTQSPEEIVQKQVEAQIQQQAVSSLETLNTTDLLSLQALANSTQSTTPNTTTNESFLDYYKKMLVDTPLDTKQNLDKKICNVVFDQITDWYNKPWFKISILLTLVLFFYPLMRFFMVIYARVLSLVYTGLKKIGFIKTQPETITRDTWTIS